MSSTGKYCELDIGGKRNKRENGKYGEKTQKRENAKNGEKCEKQETWNMQNPYND